MRICFVQKSFSQQDMAHFCRKIEEIGENLPDMLEIFKFLNKLPGSIFGFMEAGKS